MTRSLSKPGFSGIPPVKTVVEDRSTSNLTTPQEFRLLQNYPNPFNPETEIQFELSQASLVSLRIYSVLGSVVRTLAEGTATAGTHRARWDGRDDLGRPVASGVYLCRLQAGEFAQVKKMSLVR